MSLLVTSMLLYLKFYRNCNLKSVLHNVSFEIFVCLATTVLIHKMFGAVVPNLFSCCDPIKKYYKSAQPQLLCAT